MLTMSKLQTMRAAISDFVPHGVSVAMGLQMEQMIPFAAGHEIIRQKKRGLTLIGPISDILFDQMIGAGCVDQIIAAWVGNVMKLHGCRLNDMSRDPVSGDWTIRVSRMREPLYGKTEGTALGPVSGERLAKVTRHPLGKVRRRRSAIQE